MCAIISIDMAQDRIRTGQLAEHETEPDSSSDPLAPAGPSNASLAARAAQVRASRQRQAERSAPEQEGEQEQQPLGMRTWHVTREGDTLWTIAEQLLGDGSLWRDILLANPLALQVSDPHTPLEQGVLLRMPLLLRTRDQSGMAGPIGADAGDGDQQIDLRLPSLGGGQPDRTFWQESIQTALQASLREFVRSGQQNPGGIDELEDAFRDAGSAAAKSFLDSALREAEEQLFPGGLDLQSGWEFAKEYPLPAALLGVGAAVGAGYYLDSQPKLKVRVGAVGLEYDMATGGYSVQLRYKLTF